MIHSKASQLSIDWLDGISFDFDAVIGIDFYNTAVEVWEPFLEPWNFDLQFKNKEKTEISLNSNSINLNISSIFMESLESAIRALKDVGDFQLKDSSQKIERNEDNYDNRTLNSPYYIRNECGISITYSLSNFGSFVILKNNEERELLDLDQISSINQSNIKYSNLNSKIKSNENSSSNLNWNERQIEAHQSLFIQLNDSLFNEYLFRDEISFHRVGTQKLKISENILSPNIASVDVCFHHGCKIITIRSNVLLFNHCDTNIDVFVSCNEKEINCYELSVKPHSKISIPIYYIDGGEISIGPSQTHQFSDAISFNTILNPKEDYFKCIKSQSCTSELPFDYFMWLSVEKQSQDRIIHLLPSVTVKNSLPIQIECYIQYEDTKQKCDHRTIQYNETVPFHLADFSRKLNIGVILPKFGDCNQCIPIQINKINETSYFTFIDDNNHSYLICCDNIMDNTTKSRKLIFYSNYWIVNRVGLPLLYSTKGSKSIEAGQDENLIPSLQGDPRTWYSSKSNIPEPYLYSNTNTKRIPLCIQVVDSQWSSSVELATEGMITVLSIPSSPTIDNIIRSYELAVTVKPNENLYWKTREVVITPRYLLINQTKHSILYRQQETKDFFTLSSNQQLPFHWFDQSKPKFLCLCKPNLTWKESSPIDIKKLGNYSVKLRKNDHYDAVMGHRQQYINDMNSSLLHADLLHHSDDHQGEDDSDVSSHKNFIILSINVQLEKHSNVTLIVINENMEYPDLRIDNQLPSTPIYISQLKTTYVDLIEPNTSVPFAWDNLQLKKKVNITICNENFHFSFKKLIKQQIKVNKYIDDEFPEDIFVEIIADGPTKVLKLTEKDQIIDFSSSVFIDDEEFIELSYKEEPLETIISFSISRIGLSFINHKPEEIIYGVIDDIEFSFLESETTQFFDFQLGRVQIDNQLLDSPHSVLFYPITTHPHFFEIQGTRKTDVSFILLFFK